MTSVTPPFFFIANNLAVDFANTEIVDRGQSIDLLANTDSLLEWARKAGFAIANNDCAPSMSEVRALRSAIKVLLTVKLDGKPASPETINTINYWLPKGVVEQQLDETAGQFVLSPAYPRLTIDMLLGRIAVEAAQLLSSVQLKKLKHCANTQCVLMFVDTSRAGKRRWCSMDTCGNRAKAASFYTKAKV